MISRSIITDVLMIGVLVALQVFVLNRIVMFGKYTPVVYPVFVMFYPFFRNKYAFLLLSFLLGLGIDAFLGTWGINAFATTSIAFFRSLIFKTSTETSSDFFSFHTLQWTQFIFFILSCIFTHQMIVQFLEFFKLSKLLNLSVNILVTTLISFVFILIYALAFKIKQKV